MRFHGSFPLRPRALAIVVAAAFLIAGAARPARAQRYSIRDLGTLGGTFDQPLGINAAGQVVGNSNLTGDQFYHAVLFTAGPPTDLGTFSGNLSTARAINDSGQIVGFAYTTGGVARRGPVTLRLRDLERLRAALAEHPELARAFGFGGEA